MYRIFFSCIAIIVSIAILSILALKPKLHKTMLIYDSEVKVEVSANKPESVSKVENMPAIYEKNVKKEVVRKEDKKILPKKSKEQIVVQKPVKTQNISKTTKEVTSQKTVDTNSKRLIEKIQKEIEKSESTAPQPAKPVTQTVTKAQPPAKTVVATTEIPQQEVLLWNKWRSDLQNRIMADTNLPPVPNGIIFRFQFDVDKYGKISNIKSWSDSPAYTPYAINYISPVIRSYQGQSILNFPAGSNRFKTTMIGGWKISNRSLYSTPNDYKDMEVIKK